MDEQFKIRSYGYGELAHLYFPNITKKSACTRFKSWISENEKLLNRLYEIGYQKKQRLLTPRQVKLIIEAFGEP